MSDPLDKLEAIAQAASINRRQRRDYEEEYVSPAQVLALIAVVRAAQEAVKHIPNHFYASQNLRAALAELEKQ